MFSAARRGNGIRVAIETPTWKMRRGNDIAPAERWMSRKALRETPKTSARKLRWGPPYAGIKLISERWAARVPASRIDVALKLMQNAFAARKSNWVRTFARVQGPMKRWRRMTWG
jgi:hypothetical protein